MQSPIDINQDIITFSHTYDEPELNFENKVLKVSDTGHSIELDVDGEALLMNRIFSLDQIHFHSPSEHTINGVYSDVEAHFVHKSEDGRLAVIGVLFNVGEENSAFETMLDEIEDEDLTNGFEMQVSELLPEDLAFYHYIGSLTTPPLSENVEWYVLSEQLEISQEQLDRFNEYYIGNSHDTQDLNNRPVKYINK
ncbi:hypothetical protein AN641_00090 [Candidatus Epulonipiscioides gigas]|nr:hypothetical protein AN641_00090 [Epulopiscium sp. SCG-C07WGA-EpuloA2]